MVETSITNHALVLCPGDLPSRWPPRSRASSRGSLHFPPQTSPMRRQPLSPTPTTQPASPLGLSGLPFTGLSPTPTAESPYPSVHDTSTTFPAPQQPTVPSPDVGRWSATRSASARRLRSANERFRRPRDAKGSTRTDPPDAYPHARSPLATVTTLGNAPLDPAPARHELTPGAPDGNHAGSTGPVSGHGPNPAHDRDHPPSLVRTRHQRPHGPCSSQSPPQASAGSTAAASRSRTRYPQAPVYSRHVSSLAHRPVPGELGTEPRALWPGLEPRLHHSPPRLRPPPSGLHRKSAGPGQRAPLVEPRRGHVLLRAERSPRHAAAPPAVEGPAS